MSHIDLIRSLAWGLCNDFRGLGGISLSRGDTMMLLSPESTAAHLVAYAAAAAGMNLYRASCAFTASELLHHYERTGSKAIVTHPAMLSKVLSMFRLRNMNESDARRRILVIDWESGGTIPPSFVKVGDLMNNDARCESTREGAFDPNV